jgi:hypothetical protein
MVLEYGCTGYSWGFNRRLMEYQWNIGILMEYWNVNGILEF